MKSKIQLRNLKKMRLRFRRITFRALLIVLGLVVAVIVGFSLWFRYHAEQALEQIVAAQSNNKLKLKVAKFRFNWINNKIELTGATLYSTDTTAHTSYQADISKITIKARGFLPLLLNKEILIDSIRLYSPAVTFTKMAPGTKNRDSTSHNLVSEEFSVAREMGRISKSINDAINVLHIDKFIIDDGSFSLLDRFDPDNKPFVVTHIHIRLENLQIDKHKNGSPKKTIPFTDDIAVQSVDQNITFPSGRHLLSFKSFKVNLKNKRVEFDSCTMRGIKGDSSKSSFNIFFDKLQLTNINFDTLYHAEVIQADSVFCTNPRILFDIDADREAAKKSNKLTPERVDQLIQQLLGDIMLNYVVVNNASINLNTIKKGYTSTFSSHNNNIELQGLFIRQNVEHPLTVSKFLMTLRDYKTKLRDGQYEIAFDSIKFNDNAINLSNFDFKQYAGPVTVKHLRMPDFQLRGLSWEALLYNNDFNANSAVLYRPSIDYTANKKNGKARKSIFESLSDIGSFLHLTNLTIQEGDINLHLNDQTNLQLLHTGLSLKADELIASRKIRNVQHSIDFLRFDKGIFSNGKINLDLDEVALSQDKRGLSAKQLTIKGHNIEATVNGVDIGTLLLDSVNQRVLLEKLKWDNGTVKISTGPAGTQTAPATTTGKTTISFSDIQGGSTALDMYINGKHIRADLATVALDKLVQQAGTKPRIEGLRTTGSNFSLIGNTEKLLVNKFSIADKQQAVLDNISLLKISHTDSISLTLPRLALVPDISQFIGGNIHLDNLKIADPVITTHIGRKEAGNNHNSISPDISLGEILLERPEIRIDIEDQAAQKTYISWEGSKANSYMLIKNFASTEATPFKAGQVKTWLTGFVFINPKGKKIALNDNKLYLDFYDVRIGRNDWQAVANILSADNLHFDIPGKRNSSLDIRSGRIQNILLNSAHVSSIADIIKNSPGLVLTNSTGRLSGTKNNLSWFGVNYGNSHLTIDSLYLLPVQTPEAYHTRKAFNEDYVSFRTGAVAGQNFDMNRWVTDSVLDLQALRINDMRLISFKDKTQPDSFHRIRPLPALKILRIPLRLDIDSVLLNNMYVEYWERNKKTAGKIVIPVSNMRMLLHNVKNYNITDTDSLYITASGKANNALPTWLVLKESYTDSLHTFLVRLSAGAAKLPVFNDILLPYANARAVRGSMDSLVLTGTGNNNFAVGDMRMYYRRAKIALVNKNNPSQQSFKNKMLSWIANTFVIRKNNDGKSEFVFFERQKNKSTVSFLVKTAVAGIKSGLRVPREKRKMRAAYRKH